MTINYIPGYIRSFEDMKSGGIISAEKWNAVHNLLVTQGDKNSETLDEVVKLLNGLSGFSPLNPLDAKPAIPSAYDDEFDGSELNEKWGWVYSEDGDIRFPTAAWTPEQVAAYCSETADHGFKEFAAPLVAQYAEEYGYAMHLAFNTGNVADKYSYIFYSTRFLYFSGDIGDTKLIARVSNSYNDPPMLVRLVWDQATDTITADAPVELTDAQLDDYGVSSLPGYLKLITVAPFTQFQPDAICGEDVNGYVGTLPAPNRVLSVQNSHLILQGKYRDMWFYDNDVEFITQDIASDILPLSVSCKFRGQENSGGNYLYAGLVLRNKVTSDFVVYGSKMDSYYDTQLWFAKGTGTKLDDMDNARITGPRLGWKMQIANGAPTYVKWTLGETGVTLYRERNGEWVETDTVPYTSLFTDYQASDQDNWEIGIGFLRGGAGPYDYPMYTTEETMIDWFRVEAGVSQPEVL